MNPDDRKQYIRDWKERHDATYDEIADLVGVSRRTVQAWVDDSEHGRTPSKVVIRLLQVHEDME